jgi:alpha-L-fucosidase 2
MNQVFIFIFLILSGACFSQKNTSLKLWYDQPSGTTWENALPIGNGRLGAMVYGNVETETIQLNEHTLWSGSPNRNDNPLVLDSLSEIRKLIFDAGKKKPSGWQTGLSLKKLFYMIYQPRVARHIQLFQSKI